MNPTTTATLTNDAQASSGITPRRLSVPLDSVTGSRLEMSAARNNRSLGREAATILAAGLSPEQPTTMNTTRRGLSPEQPTTMNTTRRGLSPEQPTTMNTTRRTSAATETAARRSTPRKPRASATNERGAA